MIEIKPQPEDPKTALDMHCFDNRHIAEEMNLVERLVRSEVKQLVENPGTLWMADT